MASSLVYGRMLLAVLICGCISGCNIAGGCGETMVQAITSPDGTLAKTSIVNCGATTDYFTYVSIQKAGMKFRDGGVLFGYRGKANLHLAWNDQHQLQITCLTCDDTKVYREVAKEGAYRIRYVGVSEN
jgi:hypothetical protein